MGCQWTGLATTQASVKLPRMNSKAIVELIERKPFIPFTLCLTDGEKLEITHPDQVMVTKFHLHIGVDKSGGIFSDVRYVAPLHIVRVEEHAQH